MNIEQTEYQEDEQSRIDRLRKSVEWCAENNEPLQEIRFRTALLGAERDRIVRVSYLMGIPKRELVKEMRRTHMTDALAAAMSIVSARGNLRTK